MSKIILLALTFAIALSSSALAVEHKKMNGIDDCQNKVNIDTLLSYLNYVDTKEPPQAIPETTFDSGVFQLAAATTTGPSGGIRYV